MITYLKGVSRGDPVLREHMDLVQANFDASDQGQQAVLMVDVYPWDGGNKAPVPPEPPDSEDWDHVWEILPDGRVAFGFTVDNVETPDAPWVVRMVLFVPRVS